VGRSSIWLKWRQRVGGGPAFVAELDVPTPILGTYALETLGLKPNPVTGKLEVIGPEGGYLLQLSHLLAIERSAEEIISTFMRS
jgi:hypothetical protein